MDQDIQEYLDADDDGKDAILERYRETLMVAAREQVKKAQPKEAGRSARELERLRFLETQQYNFINGNTPSNANIKYVAVADPSCSSARPLG